MTNVTIDRLGAQGDGLASLDGRTIFIEGALPGEVADIGDIPTTAPEQVHAELRSIISASADRAPPPCRHFDECGGCSLQHIAMPAYQAWKQDALRHTLARIVQAQTTFLPSVFVPPGTRRRVTLAALKRGRNVTIGFNKARSHQIFNLDECLLVTPSLLALIQKLPQALAALLPENKPVDLFVQETDTGTDLLFTGPIGSKGKPDLDVRQDVAALLSVGDIVRISWRARERDVPEILIAGTAPLVRFGAFAVEIPPAGFLQPSLAGQTALQQAVQHGLSNLPPKQKIADLFCGAGTLSAAASAHGSVTAYDGSAPAIAALNRGSKAIGSITGVQRDLFRQPLLKPELDAFTAIILDPARAGAKDQCVHLARAAANCIIYVSCNPATFARDAEILLNGGYKLASVQIVDQFVWSSHTEIVATFLR